MKATPEMIAAAWRAFRGERTGPLIGEPGPAFREAIDAALAVATASEPKYSIDVYEGPTGATGDIGVVRPASEPASASLDDGVRIVGLTDSGKLKWHRPASEPTVTVQTTIGERTYPQPYAGEPPASEPAPASAPPEMRDLSLGDTYLEAGADLHTSGINVGKHGNRIQCYGRKPEDAEALRDEVWRVLTAPASAPSCCGVLRQVRGALILDAMVDDAGEFFGTTQVALEAINEALCDDEDCPHHSTRHVCVARPAPFEICIDCITTIGCKRESRCKWPGHILPASEPAPASAPSCCGALEGLKLSFISGAIWMRDNPAKTAEAWIEKAASESAAAIRARAQPCQCGELRAAAERVIRLRVGELPSKGWLSDNDATRLALHELAAALSKSKHQPSVAELQLIEQERPRHD